jgi:hypothetical protein
MMKTLRAIWIVPLAIGSAVLAAPPAGADRLEPEVSPVNALSRSLRQNAPVTAQAPIGCRSR